jgi:hypothetical protein
VARPTALHTAAQEISQAIGPQGCR